jgi:dihydropteroate synthase
MGIVNVTPDSFSDGGDLASADAAWRHALRLADEGAALLDVGGESTRPGSDGVSADEELGRVLPVIEALVAAGAPPVSVDTRKAAVARRAIAAGAAMVNDISALRDDPEMVEVVAEAGVPVCLMHMRGEPRTMQDDPVYGDVVDEVVRFLEERLAFAVARGVAEDAVCLDPGIGFGKTFQHNLQLLHRLERLVAIGPPILLGVSRKGFLGWLTGRDARDRTAGSVAAAVLGFTRGASLFRVHDVAPTVDALRVASAVEAAA